MKKISVVTPVYGAPGAVRELAERLTKTLKTLVGDDFEIIFVNDGCPLGSWQEIRRVTKNNEYVVGVNLSKNFGQHSAIAAGLSKAKGNWVVVMDCDLEDMPEEIPKLYDAALAGADVVFGRRVVRQNSFFKKLSSVLFAKVFNYLSGFETDHSIANFSIISRKVVDSYNQMPEQHRPYSYFINWLGFERVDIDIEHAKRTHGKSSYTFRKLLEFAFNSIVSETNKPLKIAVKLGFSLSLISFMYGMFLVYKWAMGGIVEGWTSVMVSIYFTAGILLGNMGLVGLYIGKIFDEVKSRPVFIIAEMITKADID